MVNEEPNLAEVCDALTLDDALGFLFRRLSGLADATFLTVSEQTQITPMQMGVLMTVNRLDHPSLRKLASEMEVDRSTIQELLDRMSRRGLIARRVSSSDRRAHELWLTDDGREVLERYHHCVREVQDILLAKLRPKEATALLRYLKKILY